MPLPNNHAPPAGNAINNGNVINNGADQPNNGVKNAAALPVDWANRPEHPAGGPLFVCRTPSRPSRSWRRIFKPIQRAHTAENPIRVAILKMFADTAQHIADIVKNGESQAADELVQAQQQVEQTRTNLPQAVATLRAAADAVCAKVDAKIDAVEAELAQTQRDSCEAYAQSDTPCAAVGEAATADAQSPKPILSLEDVLRFFIGIPVGLASGSLVKSIPPNVLQNITRASMPEILIWTAVGWAIVTFMSLGLKAWHFYAGQQAEFSVQSGRERHPDQDDVINWRVLRHVVAPFSGSMMVMLLEGSLLRNFIVTTNAVRDAGSVLYLFGALTFITPVVLSSSAQSWLAGRRAGKQELTEAAVVAQTKSAPDRFLYKALAYDRYAEILRQRLGELQAAKDNLIKPFEALIETLLQEISMPRSISEQWQRRLAAAWDDARLAAAQYEVELQNFADFMEPFGKGSPSRRAPIQVTFKPAYPRQSWWARFLARLKAWQARFRRPNPVVPPVPPKRE